MKGYIITGALLAVFLFFSLQRDGGPLVVLFIPIFLLMAAYQGVRMLRSTDERKSRSIRLVAWCVALLLSGALHLYWSRTDRTTADSAARKVLEYRQRTGTYPASLAETGLGERPSSSKLRYAVRDGKPTLTYPAAFLPLTTHEYDFEAGRWRRNAY